ncbi:winged helix-turn-helix domain-containing protein [Actinomadura sediminis]|uniref:Winged helix-turn-helix domain-containing protein n=1 Tax=Actinomadura sediminis TaxID=1038904 RepID=A0ABW3EK99_9ACTN
MVELDGDAPLREQLADLVEARIKDGTYPPKSAIPSGAELAAECDVSPRTATEAVKILKARGLVRGVPGKAVIVKADALDVLNNADRASSNGNKSGGK